MKKSITALSLLLASGSSMALPGLDAWVGGYNWSTSYSGDVSADPVLLNLEDNLGLGDSDNTVIWAAFEHPIPVIPNIQIKQTSLETSGTGSLNQSFNFAGNSFTASESLNSTINLDHTDLTLYWGLPLPLITIDFGLNIRKFDGDLTINGNSSILDVPVPMLFGRVGAALPFTGLEIMAEGNYIGIGDTSHLDYQVVLRYTLPVIPVLDVNLEAGYRSFELDIDPTDFDGDKNDLTADIDMSGVFFGVSLHL